ncbi:glycoside hydrolase family 5 protein [Polychaeton citri CBS 116435]|uniref:cellulase n=1 Tax=Polychaeton citri CBS 116435 TaxID=1314669 RepID=A0A9P4Q8H9_9PEZI|nr:glycoside hydrolase family 5 protein [Polychaeton citri CBS 116435]
MHFSIRTTFLAALSGLAIAAPTTKPSHMKRAPSFQFIGINESGPEFGEGSLPGMIHKEYTWPDLSTIETFTSKGLNTFRINTLMERMAPGNMSGPSFYIGNLTETVNAVTSAGAYAMINPHNYGRYYNQIITDTNAFKQFWQNVATVYRNNEKVVFDTNNEFHDMSSAQVAQLNQAAIDGIRAARASSQYITVEGNAWTGAWTWTTSTGTDGQTNARAMAGLKDPEDKIIYQMHQYLDSDGSGTGNMYWLRQNQKRGIIGEFAGATNAVCEEAVQDMLAYLAENNDVWTGALWWPAGPWWGSYMFSIESKDGPAYSTYVPLLSQYAL